MVTVKKVVLDSGILPYVSATFPAKEAVWAMCNVGNVFFIRGDEL